MINPFLEQAELALLAQDTELALRLVRMGLSLLPDDLELREMAAICAGQVGQHEAAVQDWRHLLAHGPQTEHYANELSLALQRCGRPDEAEACLRETLARCPGDVTLLCNLGALLHEQSREEQAETVLREALRLDPAHAVSRVNLGQLLLSQGRLREGWPYNESRLSLMIGAEDGPIELPDLPPWQGGRLDGKTILVMPEQGLGDEIQFCRFLPWVKAQGAARVIHVCRTPLLPVMRTLSGADAVIALPELGKVYAEADTWVWLMSLPGLAGIAEADIPPAPYLQADPARVAAWPLPPAAGHLRVGFTWRGNPRHDNDADRSLPGPQTLAPLWQVPGIDWYNLQLPVEDEWPAEQPCHDLRQGIADFADTAAVLAQLDLVISVDTSVAHLAGALGRPCWLLLPARKCDWRWFRGRSDTPWYGSLRLFRQPVRGDWASPLAAIGAELAQRVARREA